MTDLNDLAVPEHVGQLRQYVERAEGPARAGAAWLLAQAIAAHLVASRCTGANAVALAEEGLSALTDSNLQAAVRDQEAVALVESLLQWRRHLGSGDQAAAATEHAQLAERVHGAIPEQVRQLAQQVTELLAAQEPAPTGRAEPVTPDSSADPSQDADGTSWMESMFGVQLGPDLVMPGEEQTLALVEAAGRLRRSDPQRARWLLQAAQQQQARAFGRRRWTEREDDIAQQAVAAASQISTELGPDWMTRADRTLLLMVRATPHLAEMQGIRAPGSSSRVLAELSELGEEADRLVAECDAAQAASPAAGPTSLGTEALAGIGALVHLVHAQSLWREEARDQMEEAVGRAETHLRRVPAATADMLRQMLPLMRHHPGDVPSAQMIDAMNAVAPTAPEQFDAIGGQLPRVLGLARQASLSGRPAQLAEAIDAVAAALANLGEHHPGTAHVLGVLCELRTNHAVATSSPEELPAALDAGIEATRTALTAGPDSGGPDLQTVGALSNALVVALAMNHRAGPYDRAAQTLEQALTHPCVSSDSAVGGLHLDVTLGAGVARLMHWRVTGDQEARTRGQAHLNQTEKTLLARRTATIDWIRRAFGLLQVYSTTVTTWGDASVAPSALRILTALEETLDEHPHLAAQAQQILTGAGPDGPSNGPAAGMASDYRRMLQMMRGLFELMGVGTIPAGRAADAHVTQHALSQIFSGNTGSDMTSILDEAMRRMGIDPNMLQAMTGQAMADPNMRRHLEQLLGPQAGTFDQIHQLSDLLAQTTPTPPTPRDDATSPPTPPTVPVAGSDEARTAADDEQALRARLREIENVLATGRARTSRSERVRLLDERALLRRRLAAVDPLLGRSAVDAARVALREIAQLVIAGETLPERLTTAAQAAPIAARAVGWAIEDGDLEAAVGVAENSRALSLAAVLLRPALLKLAGGDLGRSQAEVLANVSMSMDGQVTLLSPPLQHVEAALLNTDLDALVYLIPPSQDGPGRQPGHALVLRRGYEGITLVELPDSTVELSAAPFAPQQALRDHLTAVEQGNHDQGATRQAWDDALDAQGAWCYRAILGPVLARVRAWELNRPPHLGLVPLGQWAAIPFAAAWYPDPDIPQLRRYAIQEAVFSATPSARVLMRTAATTGMRIDDEVLVVVHPVDRGDARASRSSFPFARAFGRAATTPFPDATVLQSASGAGTSARILEALGEGADRAASLLHLTTHGRLEPEASVQVADGWLPLTQILASSDHADPDRPGGTVVINACLTDAMRADDAAPDEALTLATAILAGGAKHVIGTRWPVPEGPGAVFGYHLLKHLSRGTSPAHALHAAQLDMLDGIPGPGALAHEPATELGAPRVWAAYTHQGA